VTVTRANTPRVAFIGFGEAGQAIATGLRGEGVERIAAWDILFPQDDGARLKAAADKAGVRVATSAADAVDDADIVIAAVTAASSVEAARSAVSDLTGSPYYLDINSVSPGKKNDTAALLGDRARYVDVAVIAAILDKLHKTPMLLAGPNAQAVSPLLTELGMNVKIAGDKIGTAAAIKMIRSVMIKGIEALTLETFIAAQRAGLVDEVTASMKTNYPGLDFVKMAEYNVERMASHGERRAAEMEESARTLRELGLEPRMVDAMVGDHREMGAIGKDEKVVTAKTQGRDALLKAVSEAKGRK
jgi:3-hydroxyisobutyrate dehydrogenase-like beta-hydroxyacid dehydrogenase